MIRFDAITKSFGDSQVLDGLTFEVRRGETYGLLGPNGSGKTTSLKILCNLLDADSGHVTIAGEPVSPRTQAMVGVVPQEVSVYQDLTCRENLLFFARIFGLNSNGRNRRVGRIIDTFGLQRYADTTAGHLSGGWKRRLNMAVAAVHEPAVLLFDEPTAGVDVEARYELWNLVRGLNQSGATILVTTHHLEEAEVLCTRVGILGHGKLVAEDTTEGLRGLVPAKMLAVVTGGEEEAIIAKAATLGWDHRRYGDRLTLLLPERTTLQEVVSSLSASDLTSVSLEEVRLEHAFLEITGKDKRRSGDRA